MDLTGVGADDDDGGRLVAVTGCPCGNVHRLSGEANDAYRDVVAGLPLVIPICVAGGPAWRVPRLWIAMHGLKAAELPGLAERYGWPAVSGGCSTVMDAAEVAAKFGRLAGQAESIAAELGQLRDRLALTADVDRHALTGALESAHGCRTWCEFLNGRAREASGDNG